MPYSNPDRARNYQREYRRIRRAGDECTTPGTTAVPLDFRLQTAQDAIDLLEEQVSAVRADESASVLEKARCVGYLTGVALRAIEAGNLAARVEMLERGTGKQEHGWDLSKLSDEQLEQLQQLSAVAERTGTPNADVQ